MFRTVFPFHPTLTEDCRIIAARGLKCPHRTQGGFEDWAGIVGHGIRMEVGREIARLRRAYRRFDLTPDIAWLAGTDFCPL